MVVKCKGTLDSLKVNTMDNGNTFGLGSIYDEDARGSVWFSYPAKDDEYVRASYPVGAKVEIELSARWDPMKMRFKYKLVM